MTTTQHTSGDWKAESDHCVIVNLPEGQYEIADCGMDGALSPEQMQANARLCAAAPDLYAALKTADDQLTALMAIYQYTLGDDETTKEVIEKARAAIAKAEAR